MPDQPSRIRFRELRFDDWPDVHLWGSRSDTCRYEVWGPNTLEETRAFVSSTIRANQAAPRLHYTFAVTLPEAPRVIGLGELRAQNAALQLAEIGYVLHPDFWRQGLGTQIGRALVTFGFGTLGLHRIAATCDPRNLASGRILQKCGMTYEGRLRQNVLLRDGWRDTDLYAILQEEWQPSPGEPTTE
jgi:ribosomal-protein-alanine N-acetyltransferase